MKRRDALRNMVLASIGVTLLPSCDFETFKVYKNLPLEKRQFRLIRQLQELILPLEMVKLEVEESPLDYLLSKVNDCYSMKNIEKYLSGLSEFEKFIAEKIEQKFHKLDLEDQMELISSQLDPEKNSTAIQYFINTNKDLTVEHLTRSRYFLTTHLDYEFLPGRYIGCAEI